MLQYYNFIYLFIFSSLCSLGSEESNVCSLDLDLAYSVPQLYKARVFKIYDSYGVTSSATACSDILQKKVLIDLCLIQVLLMQEHVFCIFGVIWA